VTTRLSVIIPTFNELNNIEPLIEALGTVLKDLSWEVVFVDDDSPDGTHERISEIARTNPRVRAIRRIERRGLSSACIEGMLSTSSPIVAVMDADGQHDETILPTMLEAFDDHDLDIVIGSRYTEDGNFGDWNKTRLLISRLTTRLSLLVLKEPVHDPMSGFFALHRRVYETVKEALRPQGYKILLELYVRARPERVVEVPYIFRDRKQGYSKMSVGTLWSYGCSLLELRRQIGLNASK